jgi:predicted MPP superfamily phosphohydrolase
MKSLKINRRRFFWSMFLGVPAVTLVDSLWVEPNLLKTRRIRLNEKPTHRFVHFTDLHYKGDRKYLESVVAAINKLAPDFVCMTGDIVEEKEHLSEALRILKNVKAPLYGNPGNHDYWSHADFGEIAEAFATTGGAWLVDNFTMTRDGKVTINGAGIMTSSKIQPGPKTKNVMMLHYPEWVERLTPHKFDVVLAGHSHGGQFRIPFYGALIVPFYTGKYDLGLFKTASGPLYVSSGIGWFYLNVRFNCRPEIVLFEV